MNPSKHIQQITGTVTKISSSQTAKVSTKVTKVHPLYHKRYTQNRIFTVHNPEDKAVVGQIVTIIPCRPISKSKRWTINSN